MTWSRYSDEWVDSERVERLGSDAAMLHISALSYSTRHDTDGRVARGVLRKLWPVADLDGCVARLVSDGFWVEEGEGYLIVDWADHILSAEENKKTRDQAAVRQKRYRLHKAGDHSMCDYCSARRGRNAVTDAVTDTVSDGPPTRPSPTRRGGEGRSGREATGSAARSAPGGASRSARVPSDGDMSQVRPASMEPRLWVPSTPWLEGPITPWDIGVTSTREDAHHDAVTVAPILTLPDDAEAEGWSLADIASAAATFRALRLHLAPHVEEWSGDGVVAQVRDDGVTLIVRRELCEEATAALGTVAHQWLAAQASSAPPSHALAPEVALVEAQRPW